MGTISHGSTPCRNIRMGLPELEAYFLSRKTSSDKIPDALLHPTEHGRSQPNLPPTAERNYGAKMDYPNARAFSLRHQGAPGDHSHQAFEKYRRLRPTFSQHH